jgi:hypothetical protein
MKRHKGVPRMTEKPQTDKQQPADKAGAEKPA